MHLLLVINTNFGPRPISYSFRDTTTYSLKLFNKNCGQTVVNKYVIIIDK